MPGADTTVVVTAMVGTTAGTTVGTMAGIMAGTEAGTVHGMAVTTTQDTIVLIEVTTVVNATITMVAPFVRRAPIETEPCISRVNG